MYDLAGHPTQQHLVAAGGEDGALAIWDMRSTAQPFTIISAHCGPSKNILQSLFVIVFSPRKIEKFKLFHLLGYCELRQDVQ